MFRQIYQMAYNFRGRLALIAGWVGGLRDGQAQSKECQCSGTAPAEGSQPLASIAGGGAWGVARGVSPVIEGYLEVWARPTAFIINTKPLGCAFCHTY
jgi:hypothetical protein